MVDRIPGNEYSYKSAKRKSKVEKVKRIPSYESVVPPSKKLVPESVFGANLRALAENYVKGKVGYNLTEKQLELLDEYWGLERLDKAREVESVLAEGKEIELTAAGAKVKKFSVEGEKVGEMKVPEGKAEEKVEKGEVVGEITIDLGKPEKEKTEETFKAVSKYLAGGLLNKDEAKLLSKAYGNDVKLLRIKRLKAMREMEWGPTRDEAEIEKRVAVLEERGFTVPLGKKPPRQGLPRRRPKLPIEEREGELVIRVGEEPERQVALGLDQEKMKGISVSIEKIGKLEKKETKEETAKKKEVEKEKPLEKIVPIPADIFKEFMRREHSLYTQEAMFKGMEQERLRLLKEGKLSRKYATLEELKKVGLIDEEKERRLKLARSEGGKKGQKARKEKQVRLAEEPLVALPSEMSLGTPSLPISEPIPEPIPEPIVFPKEKEIKERIMVADISLLEKKEPARDTEREGSYSVPPFRIYSGKTIIPASKKSPKRLAKMVGRREAKIVFLEKRKPETEYVAGREWLIRYAEAPERVKEEMLYEAKKKSKPVKPVKVVALKTAETVGRTVIFPFEVGYKTYKELAPKVERKVEKTEKITPASIVDISKSVTPKIPKVVARAGEEGLEKIGKSAFEAVKTAPYAGYKLIESAAERTVEILEKPKVQKWLHSPVGHVLPIRRQVDLRKAEMKRLRLYGER